MATDQPDGQKGREEVPMEEWVIDVPFNPDDLDGFLDFKITYDGLKNKDTGTEKIVRISDDSPESQELKKRLLGEE